MKQYRSDRNFTSDLLRAAKIAGGIFGYTPAIRRRAERLGHKVIREKVSPYSYRLEEDKAVWIRENANRSYYDGGVYETKRGRRYVIIPCWCGGSWMVYVDDGQRVSG